MTRRCTSLALAAVTLLASACAVPSAVSPTAAPPSPAATVPPQATPTIIVGQATATPRQPLPTPLPTFTTGPTATPGPTSTPLPTATPAASLVEVSVAEHYFEPADVLVRVGASVEWLLIGVEQHDVTSRPENFRSGPMDPGDSFSQRFDTPGRYEYICTFHFGNGMFGSVTVVP